MIEQVEGAKGAGIEENVGVYLEGRTKDETVEQAPGGAAWCRLTQVESDAAEADGSRDDVVAADVGREGEGVREPDQRQRQEAHPCSSEAPADGIDSREQEQAEHERDEADGQVIGAEDQHRQSVQGGTEPGKVGPVALETLQHAGIGGAEGSPGVDQGPGAAGQPAFVPAWSRFADEQEQVEAGEHDDGAGEEQTWPVPPERPDLERAGVHE